MRFGSRPIGGRLLHQITSELAQGYTSVTVEDLNAAGMVKNRKLARAVSDASFGEFRRQLTYKGRLVRRRGRGDRPLVPQLQDVLRVRRHPRRAPLSDRVYACTGCGLVIDRDLNAAINLARYVAPPAKTSPPCVAA